MKASKSLLGTRPSTPHLNVILSGNGKHEHSAQDRRWAIVSCWRRIYFAVIVSLHQGNRSSPGLHCTA